MTDANHGTSSLEIVYAVAGLKAAGKGEFGKRLAERFGFTVLTYSTPIRAVAERELGFEADGKTPKYKVADLVRIADRERAVNGPGYWSTPLLEIANARGIQRLVVDGFRNPGEIVTLQRSVGPETKLVLVGIIAPFDIRCARAQKRLQSGDPLTVDGFRHMDEVDRGIGQPEHGQQVDKCLAMVAPENLYDNAGTLDAYHGWIDGRAMRDLEGNAPTARQS
ncbi:MAG: hypothetical protein RLZZ324_963 [Candidatus Parcubacteria bacterium]|jgi:dephospho-CoA kinase